MPVNLQTFDTVTLLVNQVPHLASLYENRDPSFCDSVKDWMASVEAVMKNGRMRQAAEISTLKSMIISVQRGVMPSSDIAVPMRQSSGGHGYKRKILDTVCVYVLYNAQRSLQALLSPYEEKYEQARQLVRKVLLMASASGILNPVLRTTFDPATTLPSLWKSLVASRTISPWTARILEIVSLEEAFTLINQVLDEWIKDHNKNIAQ